MTFTIPEFLCGVLATIGIEITSFIVYVIIQGKKK